MDILEFYIQETPEREITANQLWRRSGSRLTFKEWLDRAKKLGVFEKWLKKSEILKKVKAIQENSMNGENKKQVKILGLHPLVATGILFTLTVFTAMALQGRQA